VISEIGGLLAELKDLGIELRMVDGRLLYRPVEAMPDELATRLREVSCQQLCLELEARSDPFTAEIIELFGGEIVPENEISETVPRDFLKEDG
jgi:hypothetical protein